MTSLVDDVTATITGHVRLVVRVLIAALIAMAIFIVSMALRVIVNAPDEGLSVVGWLLITGYLCIIVGRHYIRRGGYNL